MKSYSQNQEDLIALEYFRIRWDGKIGRLLEVGANNGSDLSNSRLMIENGWSACLIEPSSVFADLKHLHIDNENVICVNVAIGETKSKLTFYESDAHVLGGSDRALVSTLNYEETLKWRANGVKFTEKEIDVLPLKEAIPPYKFQYVSIDVEGQDWNVLKQMDLFEMDCRCLCIEHNGDEKLIHIFTEYCGQFLLTEYTRNRENIIFTI